MRLTLGTTRVMQLLGIVIAAVGLIGFWLGRDVERSALSVEQREVLGVEEDDFYASFVLAGRDVLYEPGKREPVLGEEGDILYWRYDGFKGADGTNTDTILYVNVIEDEITMVAIPRDLFTGRGAARINGVFAREGADGLRQQVADLLGVPVDYYAIINLEIFENLVDALGGVEVNVPVRMYYQDRAADLLIDLQPGLQVLDGEQAGHFVRYRQFQRGDIDRLDNVKRLAYAMLERLKQLNVRAVARVPELVDTVMQDVETNASPALVRQMIPRIPRLEIRETATVPTLEAFRVLSDGTETVGLEIDRERLRAFLAATFGGEERTGLAQAPDAPLTITNRSGVDGLGTWYRDRLVGLGVPADRVALRDASFDPSPTRLLTTTAALPQADYYTSLLGVGTQQVERLPGISAGAPGFELILGEDARGRAPTGVLASLGGQP